MCGDRVEVFVQARRRRPIADTGFEARGCAISIASADLMAETVRGRGKADTRALFETFRDWREPDSAPTHDAGSTNCWSALRRWRGFTNIRPG